MSTRFLGFYKNGMLVVLLATGGFIVVAMAYDFAYSVSQRKYGSVANQVYLLGMIIYLIYLWIRVNRNVHRVEFDEDFLYVIQRKRDILIPLENIKEVDIKSLGGVYEVELYQAEQLGKKFYFKPSLLYPFNYKKKDKMVDVLRRNINRAQARKTQMYANRLHS